MSKERGIKIFSKTRLCGLCLDETRIVSASIFIDGVGLTKKELNQIATKEAIEVWRGHLEERHRN